MKELHPLPMFFTVASIVLTAAILTDPVIMAVMFLTGMGAACLTGVKKLWLYFLPVIFTAIINPVFTHKGETALFFVNSAPITLEAVLYGLNMGVMLGGAVLWLAAYSKVTSVDKQLYLFGSINPYLGLTASCAIRFVPLLARKVKEISAAQKAMGMYGGEAAWDNLKAKLSAFGAAAMWAFENGVTTALSMNARGFGSGRRTSYTLLRFKWTDGLALCVTAVCDAVVFAFSGETAFSFYPRLTPLSGALASRAAFTLLCVYPLAAEIKERLRWRYSASKISASPTETAGQRYLKALTLR